MLLLLLLLSALGKGQELTHLAGNTSAFQSPPASSKYSSDTIVYGTLWHVYIHETVYQLLIAKLHENNVELLAIWQISLVDFTRSIPRITQDINPCRQEQILVARPGLDNVSNLRPKSLNLSDGGGTTRQDSRWCGIAEVVFKPQLAEYIHMPKPSTEYEWRWQLHSNEAFISNITFLSFEVYTLSTRSSLRLRVMEYGFNRSDFVASQFKAGYFPWSYYSGTNTVAVVLGTENLHATEFNEHCKESYQAKFQFHYQIHDNDFSFVRRRDVGLHNRLNAGLQNTHTLVYLRIQNYMAYVLTPLGVEQ